MTAAKPRIGYDSIPYLHRGGVWATSEESGGEGYRACDWGIGTLWTPKASQNLLTNPDFLLWSGGASAAPDDWIQPSTLTVAQDTAPHHGLYAVALTRVGTDDFMESETIELPASYVGRKLSLGCWVKTSVANQSIVGIVEDSAVATYSSPHTGGGAYEWISVSRTITQATTTIRARFGMFNTNGTTSWTHPVLIVGDSVDQTPDAPETAEVRFYPGFGDGESLLNNGYFRDWSDGVASAPDQWTLVGSGATVALRSDVRKIGRQSAAVTRVGNDCYLSQTLSASNLAKVLGKTLTLDGHGYATAASRARMAIAVTMRDGATVAVEYDGYNDGDSDWDAATMTTAEPIPYNATAVEVRLYVDTGDTTGFFDGLRLTVGDTSAQTPLSKPATYFAIAGHDLGSTGNSAYLEGTDDESGSWTTVAIINPDDDKSKWIDFAEASYRCWRVRIPHAAGAQPSSVGVIAFGEYLELPEFPELGFSPHNRKMRDDVALSRGGFPVGRGVQRGTIPLTLSQGWVSESFVTGDLAEFWAHAGDGGTPGGLPFFLQWDDGDHGDETLFCWLPQNSGLLAPFGHGLATERLDIRMEALSE